MDKKQSTINASIVILTKVKEKQFIIPKDIEVFLETNFEMHLSIFRLCGSLMGRFFYLKLCQKPYCIISPTSTSPQPCITTTW